MDNTTKINHSENEKRTLNFDLNLKEMTEVGMNLGYHRSYSHSKMKPYIKTINNGFSIIDLRVTNFYFLEALNFIKTLASKKEKILFVGTRPQDKRLVQEIATDGDMFFVNQKWIAGLLTNFKVISKAIEKLEQLREMTEVKPQLKTSIKKQDIVLSKENNSSSTDNGSFSARGRSEQIKIEQEREQIMVQEEEESLSSMYLQNYTAKKILLAQKMIKKSELKFQGIRKMKELPTAIFVLDINKEKTAIREAKKMGLKTIAIVDTNVDPNLVDYIIIGNNKSIVSLKYVLIQVKKAIEEGLKEDINQLK